MTPSDDRGRDAAPKPVRTDPAGGAPSPSAETTSAVVRVGRAREDAAATAAPAFVPATLDAPASRDLANVTFPTVWRGYDTAAVDAYVRQVSRALTELEETRTPQDVVRRALDRVGEETSQILREAEEAAQRITTKSRADAAERVQKAENEAHEITQRARTRLRELDARSGGRRVAWTPEWDEARAWLAELAGAVPDVQVEFDACGNLWARPTGDSERTVAVGSHLDCVPEGGWLDGALGVLTGLGLLEELAGQARGRTLAVVDWADEEGARFGRSLLGSSAAVGLLTTAEVEQLQDAHGVRLLDEVSARDFDLLAGPVPEIADLDAYLELHIEQGPVLEAQRRSCAAVDGCLGVRRWRATFHGQAAHAGTTPMDARRDPIAAASRLRLALDGAATEIHGLATIGEIHADPNVPTAIAERCSVIVDLRHATQQGLDRLDHEARRLAAGAARDTRTDLAIEEIWAIEPLQFDPRLVALAARAAGGGTPLTSGALHDAAAVASAGIRTAMMFAPSTHGLSHTRREDTPERDLIAAITAFSTLVSNLLDDKEPPHDH